MKSIICILLLVSIVSQVELVSGDCTSYCANYAVNCTINYAQYYGGSPTTCMTECAFFPNNATLAQAGDSLQCRDYHASVSVANSIHCNHSAPDSDGTGLCGSQCQNYCDKMMATCGTPNMQFPDYATCLYECSYYPLMNSDGSMIPFGITSGDSYECRYYHSTAAQGNAPLHCPHAGPFGGNGVCGTACNNYCDHIQMACTGANQQYATTTACMTACAGFTVGNLVYGNAVSANTLTCRLYHVEVAGMSTNGVPNAGTHCPHAGPTGGGVCVNATSTSSTGNSGPTSSTGGGNSAASTQQVAFGVALATFFVAMLL